MTGPSCPRTFRLGCLYVNPLLPWVSHGFGITAACFVAVWAMSLVSHRQVIPRPRYNTLLLLRVCFPCHTHLDDRLAPDNDLLFVASTFV